MRKLILAVLFVGVLSNTYCGPVNQSGGLDQRNQARQLTITTAKLPTGIIGSYYSVQLSAAGGQPPYRWGITQGALPAGLALDSSTGEVSGIPTQFMRSTLLLRVADSSSAGEQESTALLPITIDPDHLTVLTPDLPQATLGRPYSATLEAAGGTLPYSWSILEGSLPSGLDLDPLSGIIQGTPTQAGTSVFVIQAADSSTPPASIAYRFPPLPQTDTPAR